MRLYKPFLSIGLLALCGLTAPLAFADEIEYAITVDTSSQLANMGWIEFQFNGSPSGSQPADAEISNFATDGTIIPPPQLTGDASGALPGTVSMDNGTNFDDYFEALTFGNTVTFDLTLSGPAIGATANGEGGGTFTLDFLDSTQSNYLFTADPINDVPVFTVDVNPDGSVTPTAYGSVDTAEAPGSVVSFSQVPEPSMALLLAGGLAGMAILRRRRRARIFKGE